MIHIRTSGALLERIDAYAAECRVSRSEFCRRLLADGVRRLEEGETIDTPKGLAVRRPKGRKARQ